ncbi:Thermospermine synthase ACAULIS5 [Capsicum annuum]|nr:Thermospermine synthase ACAULIS5 [Capsicum annuum]
MEGGEGSATREVLRHKYMEKIIICDIDQEVVDFYKKHLTQIVRLFVTRSLTWSLTMPSPAELEQRQEKFDIIVGDLADPVERGPCYQLYTQSFYENIVKPKLDDTGIFVTQVPSFADTWGWVMASDQPFCLDAGKMDNKIAERIEGELLYLNGASFFSSTILNKTITKTIKNESHVYTEDNARFIHGHGVAFRN